jgi:hypothetical protein
MNPEEFMGTPFPVEEPKAKNPPEGAILDYYLKAEGEATLEIIDAKNQLVRRFSSKDRPAPAARALAIADVWIAQPARLTAHAGMNRFVWDLRYAAPGSNDEDDESGFGRQAPGPQIMPGTYTVRLTANSHTLTQPLKVVLDPRSTATPVDLSKQFELSLAISKEIAQAQDALREIRALRRTLGERSASATPEVRAKIAAVDQEAARLAGGGGGGRGGRGAAAPPGSAPTFTSISAELTTALAVAQSADRTPPATAYAIAAEAGRALTAQLTAWKSLRETKAAELIK